MDGSVPKRGNHGTPAVAGVPLGSEGGARTRDLPINSRTLCQLSYLGPSPARGIACLRCGDLEG